MSTRTRRALAAAAVTVALAGGLSACNGNSTYDHSDPMPADSSNTSPAPSNPGLSGAGQELPPPPSQNPNGIQPGNEQTTGK